VTQQASLGQLAVHRGLLHSSELRELSDLLREAVANQQPTSMARLMITRGFRAELVRETLAFGHAMDSVCCDACAQPAPMDTLSQRDERPCASCGCLLLGFRAFAPPVETLAPPQLARLTGITARYAQVLPLPESTSRPGKTTTFDKVIVPPSESGRTKRLGPEETDTEFENLLARPVDAAWLDQAPKGLGIFTSGEGDLGGRTLGAEDLAQARNAESEEFSLDAETITGPEPIAPKRTMMMPTATEAEADPPRRGGTKKMTSPDADPVVERTMELEYSPPAPPAVAPEMKGTIELDSGRAAAIAGVDSPGTARMNPKQVDEVLNRDVPWPEIGENKTKGPRVLPLVVGLVLVVGLIAVGVVVLLKNQ
jgi:hypothetical protein